MNLVSFLIPTRSACIESLTEAVESIIEGAGGNDDFEILLKVDSDDTERIGVGRHLVKGCGRVVVSDMGKGYNDMGRFVNELVSVADSKWAWLFDDDAWVEGDWYSPLSTVKCDPVKGPAVNAEFYVLGESYYRNGRNPPGTIMPTAFCKKFNHQNPVDQQWNDEINRMGWHVTQLAGVRYHHDGRRR